MIRMRSATLPDDRRIPTHRPEGRNVAQDGAPFRTRHTLRLFPAVFDASSAGVGAPAVTHDFGVPALIGLGLTHRTAPLAVRERLALSPEQASRLVAALVASGAVDEAVALSTCNRTELYL